jgi:uncharacterized protein (TIGR02217 family)
MSTAVFPSLPLIGWPVKRTEIWQTRKPLAISGKETALADWSYPRHQWELTFDGLRQAGTNMQVPSFAGAVWAEFATLAGFYDLRQGGFDSFLYTDPDDNTVTGQGIGTGDGVTTSFQLIRAFGGFAEPIYAPNVVSHVYRAGTDHSDWTVTGWGTTTPGVVTFSAAPSSGQAITADFTYYFPCRFVDDQCEFQKFLGGVYSCSKLVFKSIK